MLLRRSVSIFPYGTLLFKCSDDSSANNRYDRAIKSALTTGLVSDAPESAPAVLSVKAASAKATPVVHGATKVASAQPAPSSEAESKSDEKQSTPKSSRFFKL